MTNSIQTICTWIITCYHNTNPNNVLNNKFLDILIIINLLRKHIIIAYSKFVRKLARRVATDKKMHQIIITPRNWNWDISKTQNNKSGNDTFKVFWLINIILNLLLFNYFQISNHGKLPIKIIKYVTINLNIGGATRPLANEKLKRSYASTGIITINVLTKQYILVFCVFNVC